MQGRIHMGAGVFVDRQRHQVKAVFGKVEILLGRNAGCAEIGGEIGVIGMGQVLDLGMAAAAVKKLRRDSILSLTALMMQASHMACPFGFWRIWGAA